MGDPDSLEIILDVATEAMPKKKMADISEQEEENMSTVIQMHSSSAVSSKVMRDLMEMQFRDDMAFLRNQETRNLMKMLDTSSVDDDGDDVQFRGNEKMCGLMKRQFSSLSVDDHEYDMPFCGSNMVHILHYDLCMAVCDKNADADTFVDALEQACRRNEVDLDTIIMDHVTPTGDSLLHVAAQHGNEQVVWLIVFHYPKLLYKTGMAGDTPLHVAARAKNLVAIKKILDMDKHFMTSEEEAESSKDKVELLVIRNNYGRTALHEAVLSKDYSVVLFLLVAHQQSDLTSYWTWNHSYGCKSPMYLSVLVSSEDIVDLLLRFIPIPSGKAISNGDSPLHAAISERNKVLLKMIVETRKGLLYQRDKNNNTPLHYAAHAGYMEGIHIMLETSPIIAFQQNSDGNLPIHLACEKRKVEVVKKFLETKEWSNNAGLWLNNKGQNILHIAAMKGRTHVIKYIFKQTRFHLETVVNKGDVNGDTPLHLAARELRLWTLLLLSRHKMIDLNLVNNEGLTALDVIRMQCRIPMTREEFLAYTILVSAGVPLKANKLGIQLRTSANKEWNMKDFANTLILVAILIATVSFTAGFTVPGGFYSSDATNTKERGLALLTDRTLFKIFMAFNTVAMYSSTFGSVILLWVPLGDPRFASGVCRLALIFVNVALMAMPVAFLAAIRLIVSNNTLLALVITVIGFISIFFIIFFHIILGLFPLRTRLPVFRQIAGLLIRIIVVLAFGRSDISYSDFFGKVNQVNQVDARNRIK